ncbi:50S ribosomal protein L11 [Chytridium lagenaria]|nr:50S ribosomal protein L11 [Chytridium lagenaria]
MSTSLVRLLVPAGKASPSPPVGPALGQRGVKSMDFCKQFNDRTKHFVPNTPVRVLITVKPDRSFTFAGSSRPGHTVVGELSLKHIYEIASIKVTDPGNEDTTLEAMSSRVLAQAKNMGINVTY